MQTLNDSNKFMIKRPWAAEKALPMISQHGWSLNNIFCFQLHDFLSLPPLKKW